MSELKKLFKSDFKFNKKFGQNFIFDLNLLRAIVNDANIDENINVLEIGTGAGTLTKVLSEKAKRVISYEIDTNLKEYLLNEFENVDNVEILFSDIMQVKLSNVEEMFKGEKFVIVANLPYYITTPILFKFLEESKNLKAMYIMVQLEVAERICAEAGSEDYGAITPAIDCVGTAKISRKVSRKLFTPEPNVDSAIVEIIMDKNKFDIKNKELLSRVIKSAFARRRKTLVNNLKTDFALSNDKLAIIFNELNLNLMVRGEALNTKQFVDLANIINKNI